MPLEVNVSSIIWRRRNFAGSLIGGIKEMQEVLDFSAEHGITSDIEMISIDQIETAYERMVKSDVRYRFVIGHGLARQGSVTLAAALWRVGHGAARPITATLGASFQHAGAGS